MPTVISVKFKYAARDLWFEPAGTGAQEGDHVICDTERGQEIGLATSDAVEMSREELAHAIGDVNRLKQVVRVATDKDLERAEMLAGRADDAFPTFRNLVHESGLDMKPVGVEYLFGGGKVVCYFSAEERVDFRQLVRDLSRELHERIDMRQIGVREEAAIVGGFAHCGQELCCARFGHQFEPVSIRMAKEQDLPLNSTKISGACGRLMCCLRYEFEAYRDFKQRAPKRNAVIETPLGKAKIVEYDTPKEQICLRLENGKQVRVPLSGMEASEAAHKKSEELGCACRPDTVTRDALERLESPDVQMALAELDRQMGVIPDETFDSSDIFVDTKPSRRRRSRKGDAAEKSTGSSRKGSGKGGSAGGSNGGNGSGNGSGSGSGNGAGEGSSTRTRRRRKKSGAQGQGAQGAGGNGGNGGNGGQPKGDGQQTSRRRRRHHSAAAEGGSERARTGSEAKAQGQGGDKPKRRRRPGDHGGQQAQQQGGRPAPKGEGAGSGEGGDKPKRRRRHRGGRGRGKRGGDGNGGSGNGGGAGASE